MCFAKIPACVAGTCRCGAFPKRVVAGLVCAAVLAVAGPAGGIVVCDNPDGPNHLAVPPSDYDMVGYINAVGGASGVLVGPRYVLTAGHVANGVTPGSTTFTLHLAGGTVAYDVLKRFVHPTADLGMLVLAGDTGLPGYAMYRGNQEADKVGILVGYGQGGTGDLGWYTPRGTKRFASNVMRWVTSTNIRYEFNRPGTGDSLGAALEGSLAPGDSGGGLFLNQGGSLLLAGIHASVYPDTAAGFYGDMSIDVRVSSYVDWVYNNVRGDANWDGLVDLVDLIILARHWHQSPATWADGDFNKDNIVDLSDLVDLARNWSPARPSEGGMSLPEPAAAVLLAAGGTLLLKRRRCPGG